MTRVELSRLDDSVYMYNLVKLKSIYRDWVNTFPRIKAFYAVKCNPEEKIISTLRDCGANFDCASMTEIECVLAQNVSPDRIIYASPCKRMKDIEYAYESGIITTTFDSTCEIDKIMKVASRKNMTPMNLVLRIYAVDPSARCVLSNKYGAIQSEWDTLLSHALKVGAKINGICFHIGSGANDPGAFISALTMARELYNKATAIYGFDITTIDIGGGFSVDNLDLMASSVNTAIDRLFPPSLDSRLQIIAEPGRFFAETIARLYTKVIGAKERDGNMHYTLSDSIYGSFNCIIYDHITLNPIPLVNELSIDRNRNKEQLEVKEVKELHSTLWGATCDGFDKIYEGVRLPRLHEGDWILWKNMGAYTIAGACDFNGITFTKPLKFYIEV